MMVFVNLTRADIMLNSGELFVKSRSLPPADVKEEAGRFDINGIAQLNITEITKLPNEIDGLKYIVSRPYLSALRNAEDKRQDVVCAATNHPDTVRGERGEIISVPGFYTF